MSALPRLPLRRPGALAVGDRGPGGCASDAWPSASDDESLRPLPDTAPPRDKPPAPSSFQGLTLGKHCCAPAEGDNKPNRKGDQKLIRCTAREQNPVKTLSRSWNKRQTDSQRKTIQVSLDHFSGHCLRSERDQIVSKCCQ